MQKNPIIPIPASTVVLVRQKNENIQVYLIRRNIQSGFMGGLFAFPGGKLDPADDDIETWKKHIDLSLDQIQTRLGGNLDIKQTIAFGVAAIRETFEEAGVFLADWNHQGKDDYEKIDLLRRAGNLSNRWFKSQIELQKWILHFSELSRWSHWITPESMKYRYDTRFFIASMPQEQICRPDTQEAVQGIWIHPEKALAANLKGEISLTPPTLVTLHELLKFNHLRDLILHAQNKEWGQPRLPRAISLEKGTVIVEPWDPMYQDNEIEIKNNNLEKDVLPPGDPFSRIWYNGKIWRPIRCI